MVPFTAFSHFANRYIRCTLIYGDLYRVIFIITCYKLLYDFSIRNYTTIHRYPTFSTRYSVMCKVYTGYYGTSEIEHCLCVCTVDNLLAKTRGLSLRTGAQTMLYLSHALPGCLLLNKEDEKNTLKWEWPEFHFLISI